MLFTWESCRLPAPPTGGAPLCICSRFLRGQSDQSKQTDRTDRAERTCAHKLRTTHFLLPKQMAQNRRQKLKVSKRLWGRHSLGTYALLLYKLNCPQNRLILITPLVAEVLFPGNKPLSLRNSQRGLYSVPFDPRTTAPCPYETPHDVTTGGRRSLSIASLELALKHHAGNRCPAATP